MCFIAFLDKGYRPPMPSAWVPPRNPQAAGRPPLTGGRACSATALLAQRLRKMAVDIGSEIARERDTTCGSENCTECGQNIAICICYEIDEEDLEEDESYRDTDDYSDESNSDDLFDI